MRTKRSKLAETARFKRVSPDKLCRFLVYAVLAEVVVFGFLFTFWPGIYRMIARGL